MVRASTTLALLTACMLAACGRSDLGLDVAGASIGGGGTSSDAGSAPPDGASVSPTSDAGPSIDVSCPHLGGLQARAPWPTVRRCPGRTASTPAVGPQATPTVVWSQRAMGRWLAEPVIAADGTLYAADSARGLLAFTPAGSLKWATLLSADPVASTMLAIRADGVVYVLWGYGLAAFQLVAVSPAGSILWSTRALGGAGFDVTGNGTIETLGPDGANGIVLDAIGPDGTSLSSSGDLGLQIVSPPVLGPGGDLFAVAQGNGAPMGGVLAISPGGTVDWSAPAAGLQNNPYENALQWPIVRDDGSVVFGDGYGVHALAAGGSPSWTVGGASGILAATPDGAVYATTSFPAGLVAIQANGTTGWRWKGKGGLDRPIVDGRRTVYGAASQSIVAIASDGTQLWETTAAAMPVAIDAEGTLYAMDATGSVLSALR